MTAIPAQLTISVVPTAALTEQTWSQILSVCARAYEENMTKYFEHIGPAVHVLAYHKSELVSHAGWVERELYVEGAGSLTSAYIEAVATPPEHQNKGYARFVLSSLPNLIASYDIAALSPSDHTYYERLGWILWEGPLAYIRDAELFETPDEEVMIYVLPKTPKPLDIKAKLMVDWRPGEVW